MSCIRTYLRKASAVGVFAVLLGAAWAQETPASAQFRMGFARFAYAHPMWGGARFARGARPGSGFGYGRHGWTGAGGRYSPYPPRRIYPGYPVFVGDPVNPYGPAGGWQPRHSAARLTIPPESHHPHRIADKPQPRASAASRKIYAPHELITEFVPGASSEAIDRLARQYRLARIDSRHFSLINSQFYRWRIRDNREVEAAVGALRHEQIVARVQPDYLYSLQEQSTAVIPHGDAAQYVLGKLQIEAAQRLATGKHVRVAVIDSDIDTSHPDLAGTVVKSFDALHGTAQPDKHGTAMAGAIAAHGKLLGIAPNAEILAARAFGDTRGPARGTAFAIYESLEWAADNGARVVNMSFAGPDDPILHKMLAAAYQRNIVLVAAGGNAGPQAAPLYPAADPDVIAVTATDDRDGLYKMANHGDYIAIAAPGVEVLAVAPHRGYEITTGTSVAAAHISGIAALLLERRATLTPTDIRRILMGTAKPLGSADESTEFGAGLANAYHAELSPDARPATKSVEARR